MKTAYLLREYLRRLTLVGLLPLVAAAVLLASLLLYQVHEWKAEEVRQSAQSLADDVDAELMRRLHGLEAITTVAGQGDEPDGQRFLAEWYGHARAYDRTFDAPVLLVDEQRSILLSSRRPPGTPLGDLPQPPLQAVFEQALSSGKAQVGSVMFGPVLQQHIVPIILPINSQRAVVGVVVPQKFEGLLRKHTARPGWQASIIDGVGSTVASSHKASYASHHDRPMSRRAVATAGVAPWSAVVEVGASAFYRTHLEIGLVLLASVMLILGGSTAASWRASQGLLASVQRLAPGRMVSSSGNTTSPVPNIVEIEAARRELQRLSILRQRAQEEERSRIARDLHDGLQQDVAAAQLNLSLVLSDLDGQNKLHEPLAAAHQSVERVIKGIKQTVTGLRAAPFEATTVDAALQRLVKDFETMADVQAELEFVGDQAVIRGLPTPMATCVYRLTQECLNNVRKHARASFVHIELDISSARWLRLTISDDGVGIAKATPASTVDRDGQQREGRDGLSEVAEGFGMQSMADRVHALNGTINVRSGTAFTAGAAGAAGSGTTVVARLPLQ